MVSCLRYEGTGIVGARLLYPDGSLQHAGVIVGLGGLAGHWHGGASATDPGPMGRLGVRQSMSAVTAACMLVSRACVDAVGGMDEKLFAVAYNDVDLCLRARAAGFRVVWTPFATLIHHESVSRGSDASPSTFDRFKGEGERLRQIHGTDVFEDRAFNPWCSRDRSFPVMLPPPRLPPAR
jgi:GT2 family glycosyltransferase